MLIKSLGDFIDMVHYLMDTVISVISIKRHWCVKICRVRNFKI